MLIALTFKLVMVTVHRNIMTDTSDNIKMPMESKAGYDDFLNFLQSPTTTTAVGKKVDSSSDDDSVDAISWTDILDGKSTTKVKVVERDEAFNAFLDTLNKKTDGKNNNNSYDKEAAYASFLQFINSPAGEKTRAANNFDPNSAEAIWSDIQEGMLEEYQPSLRGFFRYWLGYGVVEKNTTAGTKDVHTYEEEETTLSSSSNSIV